MKYGDTVKLEKGTKVGMGTLKQQVYGTITGTDKDENGNVFFQVTFILNGRIRTTYIKGE